MIKLFATDVDGTMTDGCMYYDENSIEVIKKILLLFIGLEMGSPGMIQQKLCPIYGGNMQDRRHFMKKFCKE